MTRLVLDDLSEAVIYEFYKEVGMHYQLPYCLVALLLLMVLG